MHRQRCCKKKILPETYQYFHLLDIQLSLLDFLIMYKRLNVDSYLKSRVLSPVIVLCNVLNAWHHYTDFVCTIQIWNVVALDRLAVRNHYSCNYIYFFKINELNWFKLILYPNITNSPYLILGLSLLWSSDSVSIGDSLPSVLEMNI